MRLQVSLLSSTITAFSTVRLASMKHGQSNDAGRFSTPWQVTPHTGWAFARG